MQMKFYYDLYISERLQSRKEKIIENLKKGKPQPFLYLITLVTGKGRHLEFYPSMMLDQPLLRHRDLFVVGLAFGYVGAVNMIRKIAQTVYQTTLGADIEGYIQSRQKEYEESAGLQ